MTKKCFICKENDVYNNEKTCYFCDEDSFNIGKKQGILEERKKIYNIKDKEYIYDVIEQLTWLLKMDLFKISDAEQHHITRESVKFAIKVLKKYKVNFWTKKIS